MMAHWQDAVHEIAEIIYMEMPLEYQDEWLRRIREKGMWSPDPDMVEGMSKACCRNGCGKCEQ